MGRSRPDMFQCKSCGNAQSFTSHGIAVNGPNFSLCSICVHMFAAQLREQGKLKPERLLGEGAANMPLRGFLETLGEKATLGDALTALGVNREVRIRELQITLSNLRFHQGEIEVKKRRLTGEHRELEEQAGWALNDLEKLGVPREQAEKEEGSEESSEDESSS